ncbi:MAG TPA: transporter, partial [Nitrospira sp.]|nr:transporter [Nitrospira sp.]
MMLVIGFSLGLLSCSMGPDYQRSTTEMEDRFRMAGASAELPSLANLAWWDLLRDEQLQQLIRTALAENKNLQHAVAAVEEFRARALIARSDYFPGVTVAASAPAGRKANF